MQAMRHAAAKTAPRQEVLRRSCACGTCSSCAAKRSRTSGRGLESGVAPPAVHEVLRTAGRPLDTATRGFMEQRFGADFSGVRVHSDAQAASSAAEVQARAYTVGEHIVLGERARGAGDEQRLYAHELAHVVQQRASGTRGIGRLAALEIGKPSDPAEAEADRMAGEALRGPVMSKPTSHPPALRRDATPPAKPAPADAPAAKPAEKPAAAPAKSVIDTALDVDLGRHSKAGHGRADAVLNRGPAMVKAGQEAQPCELELQLKIHFDFHLGTPRTKPPGGPWPADRAKAWKREYMKAAQSTWNTDIAVFSKTVFEPQSDCPGEPCKQAVGHLRVIDVDGMTDADGKKVEAAGGTTPHFNVNVYERHPMIGESDRNAQIARGETPDDISYVGDDHSSRLFDDSTRSRDASKPQGFDDKTYRWNPGGASHETGHMLGLTHDQCGPDTDNPNDERCYSSGGIMGKGTNVGENDLKPFQVGMNATTGCEWKVSSSTRWGRVLGLIGGIVAVATAIGLGAYFGGKK